MIMDNIEQWIQVDEAPRYEVSTLGRFRGPKGLLAGTVSHNGYVHIGIMVNGKQKWWLAHRLVAGSFMKHNGRPVVNHKDGNRSNNRLDNLEWATRQHNAQDMWKRKRDSGWKSPRLQRIINEAVFRMTA